MALLDGTNAPVIRIYLDTSNRLSGKFILSYSLLGGSDVLGVPDAPFTTTIELPNTDMRSISIRRGRTREDQSFQAGQSTIVFDNLSGNYDPQFPGGGFGNVTAATGNGTTSTYTYTYSGSWQPLHVGDIVSVQGLGIASGQSLNFYNLPIVSMGSGTFTVNYAQIGVASVASGLGVFYKGYMGTDSGPLLAGGTGVQITAKYGSAAATVIYSGYIEDVQIDQGFTPMVTLVCADAITLLSKRFAYMSTPGTPIAADAQINQILNGAGWNSSYRVISSSTYSNSSINDFLSAWDACNTIALSEMGRMFIDRNGQPTFHSFADLYTRSLRNTYSDQQTSATIEYDEIAVTGGDKYVTNTVTLTVDKYQNTANSKSITATNGASASRYGSISREIVSYNYFDTDMKTIAQNMADHWGIPDYRIESIGFNPYGLSSTDWSKLLFTELGDRVTVKRTVPYRSELTYTCCVESINHDISPYDWRCSMNLSPSSL
jgi:hypothetical protein